MEGRDFKTKSHNSNRVGHVSSFHRHHHHQLYHHPPLAAVCLSGHRVYLCTSSHIIPRALSLSLYPDLNITRQRRRVRKLLIDQISPPNELAYSIAERPDSFGHRDTHLFPKFPFQNSAASALVIRNWSPAKRPLGKSAFSSLSMCEKTRLNLVRLRL